MTIWGIQLKEPTAKDWAVQLLALVFVSAMVGGLFWMVGVLDSIPKDILAMSLVYSMVTNLVGIKVTGGFKHLVLFTLGFILFYGIYQVDVGLLDAFYAM